MLKNQGCGSGEGGGVDPDPDPTKDNNVSGSDPLKTRKIEINVRFSRDFESVC